MNVRDELYKELKLKSDIAVEGLKFEPEIFQEDVQINRAIIASHNGIDGSVEDTSQYELPGGGRLEHGVTIGFIKNNNSPFSLEKKESGKYNIIEKEKVVGCVSLKLQEPPNFLSKMTSDGVYMRTIATAGGGPKYGEGQLGICYSNECSLNAKGKDCLFCNINSILSRYGEKEGIQWKTVKQVAETVKAAYDEGFDHVTITGGFIPERREMEYYLDSAEHIIDILGKDTFNGTATIGAPLDLSVIEKYKEAGFSSVALNQEVWNEHFFNAICPGKAEVCGGYQHWREALDYAVEVFGFGNVRSNFVAGLEPKEYLLEGIQTLAEKGIVATATYWSPNIGSAFEGHRTPTKEWHWDVQQKIYKILRNSGITYQQVYNATALPTILHDFYRVDEGTFPTDVD